MEINNCELKKNIFKLLRNKYCSCCGMCHKSDNINVLNLISSTCSFRESEMTENEKKNKRV